MISASVATTPEYRPNRLYAFFIAFVAATGGFLFGYDLVIISGANNLLKTQFHLNEDAFGFATSSAQIGCIAGPFLGLFFCDKFGRKMTLIISGVLLAVSALLTAIPPNIEIFNIFRIVGGLGVGLSSLAAPMYIAEVAPARIRGRLGIMYQLAIAIGALSSAIAAHYLALLLESSNPELCWRLMFASELVPIVFFMVFLVFVPRSPRWLAEKNRFEEAHQVLSKIDGAEYARREIQEIKGTINMEEGRFTELLSPGMRTALLCGCLLAFFNNWTGWTAMAYYVPDLFIKSGVGNVSDALRQFVLVNGWQVFLTVIALWLVDRLGRRKLWLGSSLLMTVAMFIAMLTFQLNWSGTVLLFVVFYCVLPHALGLGPLPWLMMSELYPTRLRAKAVAITTTIIWTAGWTATRYMPKLMEFSERHFGNIGWAFLIFVGINLLSFLFGLLLLPETKNRSLEEIAKSWHRF